MPAVQILPVATRRSRWRSNSRRAPGSWSARVEASRPSSGKVELADDEEIGGTSQLCLVVAVPTTDCLRIWSPCVRAPLLVGAWRARLVPERQILAAPVARAISSQLAEQEVDARLRVLPGRQSVGDARRRHASRRHARWGDRDRSSGPRRARFSVCSRDAGIAGVVLWPSEIAIGRAPARSGWRRQQIHAGARSARPRARPAQPRICAPRDEAQPGL